MSHVDEGRLHAWLDYGRSGMTEAEYIAVGAHLARCAECASLLAEERALRERAATILGATGPRAAERPSFEALTERARASGQLPVPLPAPRAGTQDADTRDWSGRRNRRPLVGLAWAASLMAALGLGWAASTLMDREQVAIQTESFKEATAGAPESAASLSAEAATLEAPADQAAPEMAAPPSLGAPAGGSGRAAAAPPPPAAAPGGALSLSGRASRSVDTGEPAVTGSEARGPAAVSARVAAEQEDADAVLSVAAASAITTPPVARSGFAEPAAQGAASNGQPGNVVISGRVHNAEGDPIAGANIAVRGTNLATISRQNGAFELTVPANAVASGATLQVNVLGFASVESPLSVQGGLAFEDIRLTPAAVNLEELVAVGYSQQTRQTAGSTVATTASAPAAAPAAPPMPPTPVPSVAGVPVADALGYSNQAAVIWPVVTAEQAGQRLGRAILIHPGLPLLRIEMPADGQLPMARAIHALPGGGNLTITQTRVVAGQPAPPTPVGGVTVVRGDLIVTGAGPISADSVATLLEGLR